MPDYAYTAVDVHGATQSGRLGAADAQSAALALRARGLFPTGVTPGIGPAPERAADRPPSGWAIRLGRRAGARELALFTRQLAVLTRAGMPLVRGLEVVARQERNRRFRAVIVDVAVAIKSGSTLSDGLARHPREFSQLYLSMIRAGEAGGALDAVLERLARFQEKSLQLRGRVTAALMYPVIVLAVAATILAGLLVFVVPKFKLIFADLLKGAPLPPLTQAVLAVGEWVKAHTAVLVVGLVVAGGAAQLFRRTTRGARAADALVVRLPLFGALVLKAIVARFSRTLGTLLSSGVPILPALLITRDTCEHAGLSAAIASIHDQVKAGATVARPLEQAGIFPPMVASLVDVGENTGQLPEMLGKVADIYEDEVDLAVAGLSSLIEPLMIVLLALVVGTIVIALFLPIVRIVQLMT